MDIIEFLEEQTINRSTVLYDFTYIRNDGNTVNVKLEDNKPSSVMEHEINQNVYTLRISEIHRTQTDSG
jgi:flagellar basal body rod protein FlgB